MASKFFLIALNMSDGGVIFKFYLSFVTQLKNDFKFIPNKLTLLRLRTIRYTIFFHHYTINHMPF